MTSQVFEALTEVARAIDGYNKAIESWIEELNKAEDNEARVKTLIGSAKAMRDSGGIYLAWAEHLANGLPQEEEAHPVTGEEK